MPDEWRALAPEVDWRGMARLRDFLAHAYFAVDADKLLEIVNVSIIADLPHVQRLLANLSGED